MKNLYYLLNIPIEADAKQIHRAIALAVEENRLTHHQLQTLEHAFATPESRDEYNRKLFQAYPELATPQNIPDENNYLMFVGGMAETQTRRQHRVKKSQYLTAAVLGGAFGLHHFVAKDRSAAAAHLMISLTLIGLPFMMLKAAFDIYHAAVQTPDEQGNILL